MRAAAAGAVVRSAPAPLGVRSESTLPSAATKSVARNTRSSPSRTAVREMWPKVIVTDTVSVRKPTQLRKLPSTAQMV